MGSALLFLRNHLVTAAVAFPLAGALVLAALPARRRAWLLSCALLFSALSLLACACSFAVVRGTGEIELMDLAAWIPSMNAHYRVGADGVSVLFMCLASLVCLLAAAASIGERRERTRLFLCMLLLFQSSSIGVFASLDALLFLVFWALASASLSCMIGTGGRGDRASAAVRSAVYFAAGFGSAACAIAFVAHSTGTFDIVAWYTRDFGSAEQIWIFAALAAGFGLFLPLVGLHGWLRHAASGSASAVSMLVIGVLVKIGAYGFYRIAMPVAPDAVRQAQPVMLALALAGVVYGAMLIYSRRDIPGMAAAATLSQSGLVLLGLFSLNEQAAAGAVMLAAYSGLAAAGLIFVSGCVEGRLGAFDTEDGRGAPGKMPIASAVFLVVTLAFAGIPGLAVFSGASILLLGAFQTRTAVAAAATGGAAILAAGFVPLAVRFLHGPSGKEPEEAGGARGDLGVRELAASIVVVSALVFFGLFPEAVMKRIHRPAGAFVRLSGRVRMIIPVRPDTSAMLSAEPSEEELR